MRRSLLITISCFLLLSASAQQKQYKRGLALEQSGHLSTAMEQYKQALYKNQYHVAAKAALTRVAQQQVENWLQDHFQLQSGSTMRQGSAQDLAAKILQIQAEMSYFSITIDIPKYQMDRLLKNVESTPTDQFQQEQLERLEASAKHAENSQKWLKAYLYYDSLIALAGPQSQFVSAKEQLRFHHIYRFAVMDLSPQAWDPNMLSGIQSAIGQLQHPMLEMIERLDLTTLLEEQRLALSALFDGNSAPEAGQLLGADYLLLVRIEDFSIISKPREHLSIQSFRKTQQKVYASSGDWSTRKDFVPVEVLKEVQNTVVNAEVTIKMIAVETGKIIYTEKFREHHVETTHRYLVNEPISQLFPVRGGKIILSGPYVATFREEISQQESPKSRPQLIQLVEGRIIDQLISSLLNQL